MTPIYLNSSPSPFPAELNEDQSYHFLSPNSLDSSSSSLSCNVFFNSTTHDQTGYYHREIQPPQHQQEGDNFVSHTYDHIENENSSGLKFSIWKKEIADYNHESQSDQVKWMSSKMRLMVKMNMKKSDPTAINVPNSSASTTTSTVKLEDQKLPSSPMETDNSSNSSSNNSNNPIRVCSDCNTTKTPLWRSGPRGPKSLCNACGIRQRKARRAMAAAAAENGTNLVIDRTTAILKTKIQHKDKKLNSGHVTKYKKRQCKLIAPPSPSPSPGRKNCFEDFLLNLSNNLAFPHVFPQDEKEAAILLMAISCGYVHG